MKTKDKVIVKVSYDEFHLSTLLLLEGIKRLRPATIIESIYAVSRGGLVPGVILSYALPCPLHIIDPKMLPTHVISFQANVLVIDEICDTGATFRKIRNVLPNALYAATYVKPQGVDACNAFGVWFPQHIWAEFAWGE